MNQFMTSGKVYVYGKETGKNTRQGVRFALEADASWKNFGILRLLIAVSDKTHRGFRFGCGA